MTASTFYVPLPVGASLSKNRMGGKALVGKSVRIAASAESAAPVRRYGGCTGTVNCYDPGTDCCPCACWT